MAKKNQYESFNYDIEVDKKGNVIYGCGQVTVRQKDLQLFIEVEDKIAAVISSLTPAQRKNYNKIKDIVEDDIQYPLSKEQEAEIKRVSVLPEGGEKYQ